MKTERAFWSLVEATFAWGSLSPDTGPRLIYKTGGGDSRWANCEKKENSPAPPLGVPYPGKKKISQDQYQVLKVIAIFSGLSHFVADGKPSGRDEATFHHFVNTK